MKNFVSKSLVETSRLAEQWLGGIAPRLGGATVVALNGNLGSGKTTFVQSVARALGVEGNITSPTFVLMKRYELDGVGQKGTQRFNLIHIDAYRLERGADLEALDFESITADKGNLVLIEWADNVKEGLSRDIKKISFEYVGENERSISFD